MLAKILAEYRRLSEEMQFVSQLTAFLISIFTILSLYDLAQFFYSNPESLKNQIEEAELLSSLAFQLLILLIFALRFTALFFKSSKAFRLNQILWTFGIIILAAYWLESRPIQTETHFDLYATHPSPVFNHSSQTLNALAILYLLFSPFRQIFTLINALIRLK